MNAAVPIPDKAAFEAAQITAEAQADALKLLFKGKEATVKAKGAFTDGTVNYYSGKN